MQEGNYIADEYRIILNGTTARGRFDEMDRDPKISKLDEDSRSAMEICSEMAYRFKDGEWRKSLNNGKKFADGPVRAYKVEGDRIVLYNAHGAPEGTVLLCRDGRIEESLGEVLSVYYKRK